MSVTPKIKKEQFRKVAENLYRYGDKGTHYARLSVNGKHIWKSLKTIDLALARRKLADLRNDLQKIDPKLGKTTIKSLLERYLSTVEKLDTSTRQNKASIAKVFERTWKGGLQSLVRDVKKSDVEAWLGTHRDRLSKSTLNEYLRFVRQLFEVAVSDGIIANSPTKDLKEYKRDKPIRLTPSWDEFNAIVKNIREQQFNADAKDSGDFVEFMGLAGLGNAEAFGLTWGDIDLKNEKIRVYRHKTDEGYLIPIYPQLLPFLQKLKGETEPQHDKKLFEIADAKKSLIGACKRLGLPRYSHRALRRMFITRCIEKGVDFKTIAAWQGHRDGGVLVARTYSHLTTTHSDNMAKKLI